MRVVYVIPPKKAGTDLLSFEIQFNAITNLNKLQCHYIVIQMMPIILSKTNIKIV